MIVAGNEGRVECAGIVANGGVCTVAFQRMEIITGVGRRRSWSSAEKVRLVGEVAERGVAEVARRYEVCRSLLYRWRRQMPRGELATTAGFVPVRIVPEVSAVRETKEEPPAASAAPQNTLASEVSLGRVEIVLGRARAAGCGADRSGGAGAAGGGPRSSMITVPAGVWVYLALGATDMRKGFDGLSLRAQEVLREDPFSGHLFVFRGKRGDLIKVLYWDGQGLCMFAKRLERGRFIWPQAREGTVTLSRRSWRCC
jgi:transposase